MAAEIDVPPYFICPISLDIMKDPVTISTGITFDRDSIEKWLFSQKNTTCPITKQAVQLSDGAELTPNVILRRLIQSWCTLHAAQGVERLPTPKSPVSKSQLVKLFNDAKKSPQMQMNSLQKLRSIVAQNQTNKICMEKLGTAEFLSSLITKKSLQVSKTEDELNKKACEEALIILHSLQLSESRLQSLASDGDFVDALTRCMQHCSYESRAYAVMILSSMAQVAEPAQLVNLRPELFVNLAQTLNDQICKKASKASLKVLISACPWGRNRVKAAEGGVVPVLVDLLLDAPEKRTSEMALAAMDLICQCAEGRSELLKHGAGLAVVSKKILRISQTASERAVRILYSVCRFSTTPAILTEMLQIGVVTKLCLVLQVDCGSKTKERAKEMLRMHARAWRNSACMPGSLISSYPC